MIDVSLFTPKNHKGADVHDSMKMWLVALLAALLPCVAGAAGMGRLNVLSSLGQPLVAEIDLSVSKEELGSLSARLASSDAYRTANLQYNLSMTGARITIERRPNGQSFLRIVSNRPVTEPFIDLLVELTWASGRLSREYTALLDPPGVPAAPPAPAISAVPESRPAPEAKPVQPKSAATAPAASAPAVSAPMAGGKEYGPIQRGETLGKIAKSVMPEGVTLEQMLVALYRSNPDAFIKKNLNLVRTGKVLRVPDREEVAAIGKGEASKEYRTHVADWNSYRQKVADVAGAAPADKPRAAVSGKITARVEDKGAKGDPKDVVRLSKGEAPGDAGKKSKPRSSAERIRSLEEEAIAREKALTEANDRIAQLEKTLKDMQKLVELKSPGMATAQQKAEQAAKAGAKPEVKKPDAVAKPEPAKPEAKAVEAPKPEPAKPEAKKPEAVAVAKPEPAKPEAKAVEAPKPEPAKPEAVAPAEKPAAEAPKPEATPAPKPPVEAKPAAKKPAPAPKKKEPELMDQVMDALTDPMYLAAGGGVIVIGGLAFWLARRRRSGGRTGGEPVAPRLSEAAAAAAGAAAISTDTTAAPQPAAAAPAADEVDPLAEAEVYIAYGRDGQAEEILKEALAKNPKRQDVQLKLLEIYAARKDKAAFGKVAEEFNKQTGGSGDNWVKAAALGYALDSANPLYAAGKDVVGVASPSAGGATDVDLDLGLGDSGTATDIALDAGPAAAGTDTGIVDLGGDEKPAEPAMPDFALDVPPASENKVDTAAPESNIIDFQIELPKSAGEEPTRAAPPPAAAAPADDGGLDFKLDGLDLTMETKPAAGAAGGGEKDGHWYDVQTKFDLAKAYQEMGDKDGAKEILQEVIKEGDTEQKSQAKTLLDSLG